MSGMNSKSAVIFIWENMCADTEYKYNTYGGHCILEGDTGVNSQTSPIPLPQKLISSRPNPTKKLGENPVLSTPGGMTPIPSHSRVVVFFFRRNLSVTVKI